MQTTLSTESNGKIKTVYCAIYTRKSTDEGLNGDFSSLDSQREYCGSFVKSREPEGWKVFPERYDDGGFTGGNTNRPGLKKLLSDARQGKFQVVVCYKYDRLSRNTKDFLQILEIFDRSGVAFVSVTQPIDTTSSVGRLMRSILMDFSQFEREMISERTRDKLQAMAKRGKRTGGHPIIGYNINSETRALEVNPEEKQQVLEMFETYIRTKSMHETAKIMNSKGYRMKSWTSHHGNPCGGQPFNRATLWNLLQNPLYTGKIVHRKQIYQGQQEPIISEALFNEAVAMLRQNGHGRKHRIIEDRKHTFLLRGLLKCSCCNTSMTPGWATPKKNGAYRRFFYYKCLSVVKGDRTSCKVRSVPAPAIEEYVIKRIGVVSQNKVFVDEIVKRAHDAGCVELPVKLDERKKAQFDRGKVQVQIESLVNVLATQGGSQCKNFTAIMESLNRLQERRDELDQNLAAMEIEIKKLEEQQIDADVIQQNLGNFAQVFNKLDDIGKMDLTALMVKQVNWDGVNMKVGIEMRAAWRVFGDLNQLETRFGQCQTSLPKEDSNQKNFTQCQPQGDQ